MNELEHLFPANTAVPERYSGSGRNPFRFPHRERRSHGQRLVRRLREIDRQLVEEAERDDDVPPPKGVVIDVQSSAGYPLKLDRLEQPSKGIQLRSTRVVDDITHAAVFVPKDAFRHLIRKFEQYVSEDTKEKKLPRHQELVESIDDLRRAGLELFWTDQSEPFPKEDVEAIWWEIWLADEVSSEDVVDEFLAKARVHGIDVASRQIRFPERRVILAKATISQLANVANLFDILAELRKATTAPSEYLQLSPRDQEAFVADLVSRTVPPPEDAPAVCHLDTGVNRGHPLIQSALSEDHVLTVREDWLPTDRDGHGTAMAGLALYGEALEDSLDGEDRIELKHRLESVKMFQAEHHLEAELFGEVTCRAVARIEEVACERQARAICMPITWNALDEGNPTSWSGCVDQLCAGKNEGTELDGPRRLIIISAGNTERDGRHEYPSHNAVHGIQDPAHAWNAVTVGAYTTKEAICENGYEDWSHIAPSGGLSPSSSTSLVWDDRSWPLKPEIVMEGGNNAVNPASGEADDVDDLNLLTTALSYDGRMLTTTGETSAAAALAARLAARIWTTYPGLWPETVRAMLVHSARYTEQMLKDYPGTNLNDRESRLRCCGYGVPSLDRAVRSMANRATMIVQETLQPYEKEDKSAPKMNEMHLHRLPWPAEVLRDLGATDVTMRITLSYFVEPSPGERGWGAKYRYQSHGLRFQVKRPGDSLDVFRKRINVAARDEGEKSPGGTDDRSWLHGSDLRKKGSIHSDEWTGSAAELAECGVIAVHPVGGWWLDRKSQKCWDRKARYSLIVTLETDKQDVDLYTPIAQQIKVAAETAVEAETQTAIEIDGIGNSES